MYATAPKEFAKQTKTPVFFFHDFFFFFAMNSKADSLSHSKPHVNKEEATVSVQS